MIRAGIAVCALFLVTSDVLGQSRPHQGFIVDQTSTISNQHKRQINGICQRVRDRTTGEIMVCVIRTTNGQDHRQFGKHLFNHWGIGDQFANKGILVFVAMQDRKAEILLGDGIDSDREETMARTVMSDYMMPQFKRGKPSTGIRVAVDELAKRFFRVQRAVAQQKSTVANTVRGGSEPVAASRQQQNVLAETNVVFDEAVSNTTVEHVQRPIPLRGQRGGGGIPWLGMLAGGLTVGGAGFGAFHLLTRRRRPRNCQQCGQTMMLLDEVSDDEHLDAGEQLEETIGSVDYDVWVCTSCDHALKLRYGKFFSRYKGCSSCGVKASTSKSRTVRAASTMMSGLREVETTCAHCSFHDVTQHVIPRVVHNNSSNFSSGGGSSFGGGGGGFGGGGTSSGGGASGGW